jgi:leucyl-tRNA---protein transferase
MTESGIYYPEKMSHEQLDRLLDKGWYRMGSGVFTCHYIVQNDRFHRVHWMRYDLKKLNPRKQHPAIFKRNRLFDFNIEPFVLTDELEYLYRLYKKGIDFDPAPSVRDWLIKEGKTPPFDTRLITLRYQGNLMAAGVFDVAAKSLAGIMSFYDPAFRKYSAGKYLLLLKIEYAKSLGMNWFYPGYVVSGLPRFDYKIFPGEAACEIYVPELDQWSPYERDFVDRMAMDL